VAILRTDVTEEKSPIAILHLLQEAATSNVVNIYFIAYLTLLVSL
jgi:hypothetical protein